MSENARFCKNQKYLKLDKCVQICLESIKTKVNQKLKLYGRCGRDKNCIMDNMNIKNIRNVRYRLDELCGL